MTDIVPAVAVELAEKSSDPVGYVIEACERAKTWLAQALEHGGIEDIVELKSQAEAIRVYTMQKQLGKDAELSAAEIVRRAERGIGLAVRKGQAAGEINSRGSSLRRGVSGVHDVNTGATVPEITGEHKSVVSDFYSLTDGVSDGDFEEALSVAKDEGNLSRANVVKTVKVITDPETALPELPEERAEAVRTERKRRYDASDRHELLRKTRRLDPRRVINETVIALDGLVTGLGLLTDEHYDALGAAEVEQWSNSLSESMRSLNRLSRKLKELNHG